MFSNSVIIFFYMLQHLSSLLLLKKGIREFVYFIFIGVGSFFLVYILKQPSYDLLVYVEAFSYADLFEPGYYLLSISLVNLGLSNEMALAVIRLMLAFLFLFIPFKYLEKPDSFLERAVYLIVIISSVAFSLGVNNAIRQGYSSILIMLSLYFFLNKRWLPTLFFLLIAASFHKSAPLFWGYSIFIYYQLKTIYEGRLGKIQFIKFSTGVNNLVLFLIPIIVVILILVLIQDFLYGAYIGQNISAQDTERTAAIIKTSVIFVVLIISEILFGKHSETLTHFDYLRFIRVAFFTLVFWLSLNPMLDELASRVLYFYFVIELFVAISAYQLNLKWGTVVILLSYAFALNAINIFTGGGQ